VAGKARSSARSRNGASDRARVRVRMYRQGLGDAFLLTFDPDGHDPAHVLIDLGTIGAGSGIDMSQVVAELMQETRGHLCAVVATHEHQDHVSGFPKALKAGLAADEAWLAWTEDATDGDAKGLQRYRGDLVGAAATATVALERSKQRDHQMLARAAWEVLAFQDSKTSLVQLAAKGLAGGLARRTAAGMDAAMSMAPDGLHYFSPGDVIERAWAPGIRFFVLGPPRSHSALRNLGAHGSPDLYELAAAAGVGFAADRQPPPPFEARFKIGRQQLTPEIAAMCGAEPWRCIDGIGLAGAAELALQLDNLTNNTSLVLAIEIDGDRVLLFAADAQLGSWLTWGDVGFVVPEDGRRRTVTGRDLLERTVFYKVGHHASHNATASRSGLELMGGAGLTAFVPLDRKVAEKKRWSMPAKNLDTALRRKTRGRVFCSDTAESARGVLVTRESVDYTLPALRAARGPIVVPDLPSRPRPAPVRRAGATARQRGRRASHR